MLIEFDKVAEAVPEKESLEPAGLADLDPPTANTLQFEWIRHVEKNGKDAPFYVFDDLGKLFRVSPDNVGASLTALPFAQQWVPGARSLVLEGPGAWDQLYAYFGNNFWLPSSAEKSATLRVEATEVLAQTSALMSNMVDLLLNKSSFTAQDILGYLSSVAREDKGRDAILSLGYSVGNDVAIAILRSMINDSGLQNELGQLQWIQKNTPEDIDLIDEILHSKRPVDMGKHHEEYTAPVYFE